jgi:hypothetical protein
MTILLRGETMTFAELPVGAKFVFAGDGMLRRYYVKRNAQWADIADIGVRMHPDWTVDEVIENDDESQ